jgi:DNA topoisomerase-1
MPGPCPTCGFPVLVDKFTKAKGAHVACGNKECSWVKGEE